MIVDTSAIIAVLRNEADAERYIEALSRRSSWWIAAPSYVETSAVVDGNRDPVLSARLDDLLSAVGIEIAPFTAEHAAIARGAYRDYGKGSGHRAGLNLGDCFSYALARATGQPLLYKGHDFSETDIASVLEPDE